MILKTRSVDGGWLWRDQVRTVNVGAYVASPEHPEAARTFQSIRELRMWVDQTYGDDSMRDFVDEWWPSFLGSPSRDVDPSFDATTAYGSYCIRPLVATLDDGGKMLVLIGQETYLLNDQGDTIERL